MAASHAFQLTIVNCPSQVCVFLRALWHAGREIEIAAEREGERERGCFSASLSSAPDDGAPSPLPSLLRLNLNLLVRGRKKTDLKQDLAKTNLAFVSADDPATAYPFLEVNGW